MFKDKMLYTMWTSQVQPNVHSSRDSPVTFQDQLDETHCPILPLYFDQIAPIAKTAKVWLGFLVGQAYSKVASS